MNMIQEFIYKSSICNKDKKTILNLIKIITYSIIIKERGVTYENTEI